MSWLDDLESRLDSQLEAFLQAIPGQQALLADQERQDRLGQLKRRRLDVQQQADQHRQQLLQLAVEIRQWQERVERARGAAATELADRAEDHISELMERGRLLWQALAELGKEFTALEWELTELGGRRAQGGKAAAPEPEPKPAEPANLDSDWAAFEAQQELEKLRRRMQH